MKQNLLVLDVDYIVEGNKAITRLFCKDEKGKTALVMDSNFEPYFYVMPTKGTLEKLKKKIEGLDTKNLEAKILRVETVEKNWMNEETKLIKVTIDNPRRIPDVRNAIKDWKEVEETYEYNITYYRRYMIDKQIKPMGWVEVEGELKESNGYQVDRIIEASSVKATDMEKDIDFKVLAFDTEFVEEDGKSKLIMLSLVFDGKYKRVLTSCDWKDKPNYVEVVRDEKEIIQRFMDIVKEKDPDFIVGYNSDGFDIPKIKDRATVYKMPLKLGRDNTPVHVVRRGRISSAKTKGRVHIDLFNFIDHILSASMRSEVLTLDEVAQELLGIGKRKMKYKEMVEIWSKKEQLGRLAEYSLWDSELTLKLAEHILPQIFSISRLTGLLPFDASRNTYSQLIEAFLMRRAFTDNVLIPNKPKTEEIERRRMAPVYKGAIVIEPKKGIHSDILVFDFRSLPPWEKTYVKDPAGFIKVVEIGNFVERFQKNGKVIRESRSLITELNGWKALTFDEEKNKVCWKPIKAVIKHEIKCPYLLKITTEQGKQITITPNHSIFSLDNDGKLTLVRGDELRIGTNLILLKRIPVRENLKKLDVMELLSSLSQKITSDLLIILPRKKLPHKKRLKTWMNILNELRGASSLEELRERLKYHRATIRKNLVLLRRKGLIDYRNYSGIKLLQEGENYLKFVLNLRPTRKRGFLQARFNDIKNINVPEKLKKDLFLKQSRGRWKRILPCVLELNRNTCWSFGIYVAEGWMTKHSRIYFSTSDELIKNRLLRTLSYFEPSEYKDGKGFEISISNKPFALLLIKLFGHNSHHKHLNPLLLQLQKNLKLKLIEGMIDGDGSIGETKFKYTSISERLIDDLNLLLLSLSVGRTSFISSGKIKNLYVYQSLGKIKIRKGVRESHPLYLIPRNYVEDHITSTLKNAHRGSRIDIQKVAENLVINGCFPEKLKFFFGNCGLEQIKKIERIKYNGWVYDISVKDTEKFFAGNGLILVHNSLYPTIIVSHNISPETLNCEHSECKEKNKVPESKWHFCTRKEGFIPKHIRDLIETRKKIKEKMKEVRKDSVEWKRLDNEQYALKILANASYGFMGYIAAKWYCRECASATATFGRAYITKVIEMAKASGFKILYADTDSCMVTIEKRGRK